VPIILHAQYLELLLLLRHHLSPLVLKTLFERSTFPLTLRGTRIVFLLLKQIPAELSMEAEVFLMLLILIKIVASEVGAAEARPGWMRVLAMEIMRGYAALSICLWLFAYPGYWRTLTHVQALQ